MANMTPTTHAVFVPELWSPNAIIARKAKMVMKGLVTTEYDGIISKYGDTVNIPNVTAMTTGDKTVNVDVTFEANTEANTQILINKHKYSAFKLEDITRIQANQNLRELYSAEIGNALAQRTDQDLLLEYANAGHLRGTPGTSISDATILLAQQDLDDDNVPDDGLRSLVIKPSQKRAMLLIEKFVRMDWTGRALGQNPIVTGKFGTIYNFDVYVTTNVFSHGSPTAEHNLFFHKSALTLCTQMDIRIQADYNIRSLAWEVVADVLYGVKTLRADHMVDIQTG